MPQQDKGHLLCELVKVMDFMEKKVEGMLGFKSSRSYEVEKVEAAYGIKSNETSELQKIHQSQKALQTQLDALKNENSYLA